MPSPFSFICLIIALLFLYRTIISFLIVINKKFLIDEQQYIYLVYISFICLLVAIFKNVIVGIVGIILTPVVLIGYFLVIKKRVYWIVNGVNTNLATYGNALLEFDKRFKDGNYMKEHINLRKVESKIKISFENVELEQKDAIVKLFKQVAKTHAKKFNVRQFIYLLINIAVFIVFLSIGVVYL